MKAIYYVIWIVLIVASLLLANVIFKAFIENDTVCLGLSALIGIIVTMLKDRIFGLLDRLFKDTDDSTRLEKIEEEEYKEKKEIIEEEEKQFYDE